MSGDPRFVVRADPFSRSLTVCDSACGVVEFSFCHVSIGPCKAAGIDPEKLAAKIAELLNDGSLIVNCDEAGEDDAS